MTVKAGLIILKYLLLKSISHKFILWKTVTPAKKPRMVSKIPFPRSVKENLARDRKRPESPCLRVSRNENKPFPARPTSAPPKREKKNDDFGARLHNKAQEIEIKKQKIRKSLKVDYSFRPTLAENTSKWLNKSSRENKNYKEEIAVVSSASILNFTRSSIPNSIIGASYMENVTKVRPVVMQRGETRFTDNNIKENYYN